MERGVQIFKAAVPSLVKIYTCPTASCEDQRVGSGFFISSDGQLLTNYHVIRRARTIEVLAITTLKKYDHVTILEVDPLHDLAKLQVGNGQVTTHPMSRHTGQIPGEGSTVFALSNPEGLTKVFSGGRLTHGNISNAFHDRHDTNAYPILYFDGVASYGSSGAPLILESTGKVIGVITGGAIRNQLAFAVPLTHFKPARGDTRQRDIASFPWDLVESGIPEDDYYGSDLLAGNMEPDEPTMFSGYVLSKRRGGIANAVVTAIRRTERGFTVIRSPPSNSIGRYSLKVPFREGEQWVLRAQHLMYKPAENPLDPAVSLTWDPELSVRDGLVQEHDLFFARPTVVSLQRGHKTLRLFSWHMKQDGLVSYTREWALTDDARPRPEWLSVSPTHGYAKAGGMYVNLRFVPDQGEAPDSLTHLAFEVTKPALRIEAVDVFVGEADVLRISGMVVADGPAPSETILVTATVNDEDVTAITHGGYYSLDIPSRYRDFEVVLRITADIWKPKYPESLQIRLDQEHKVVDIHVIFK